MNSLRSSRQYSGLVECVALDTERITTQSQTQVLFTTQVDVTEDQNEIVPSIQTNLTNDDGIVKLEVIKGTNGDESMSSDSEVEIVSPVTFTKPQTRQKELPEDIGINIASLLLRFALTFSCFCRYG